MNDLDEQSRRKPTWQGGEWATLGRWGAWSFPIPKPVVKSTDLAAGRVHVEFEINGQPATNLVGFHILILEGEPSGELLLAMMQYVLSFNYELANDEFMRLLTDGILDPSRAAVNERIFKAIYTDPIHAAEGITKGLPKVDPDRSGTDVASN